jgi:hypothetical protein
MYANNYVPAMCNPIFNTVVYQTFFPTVYAPRTQSSYYKFFLSPTGLLCVAMDIFIYVLPYFVAIYVLFPFPFYVHVYNCYIK